MKIAIIFTPIKLASWILLSYLFQVGSHSDESRTLVISNGGIIKLIVGLTMPVDLPVGLVWLQNFQFQYAMVDRASQLSYLNLIRKSTNGVFTRNSAYGMLAETLSSFGMNGTECVLRLICDVARYSLSHNGILGQLLHTIFRPHRTSLNIYKNAMILGRQQDNCEKYSHCKQNILDQFI